MKIQDRSISELVEKQCRRWESAAQQHIDAIQRPIITLSRETGSHGQQIAALLAKRYKLELYAGNIMDKVAKSQDLRSIVLRTFDEQPRSFLDDLLSIIDSKYSITSDEYLKLLVQMISAAGKVGRAVIVGRGANFILPSDRTFRVRIVSPLHFRIENVVKEMNLSEDAARAYIEETDAKRGEFVRHYFYSEIKDPVHYDLVLNSHRLGIDRCVDLIAKASPWPLLSGK